VTTTGSNLRLDGDRLYLRPLRPADATAAYARWLNDPEVNRFLESRFRSHAVEDLRQFIGKIGSDPACLFLAIRLHDADRHIGNIKLGPIDPHHRLGDIGLLIGEKDCWGRGYAAEAVRLLADHAFTELRLHKLTASCYGPHRSSARAFEKAGFKIEAVRPSHFQCEGRWVDAILLGKINPADAGEGPP
jgi:RimJ/RimL family protein N-acetyltransferase